MTNKTIVVSDIDDTIKWSHILGTTLELLESGLNHRLAFKGMPELYTSLAKSGAKFSYVTGAPDILIGHVEADSLPRKVISTNNFPDAVPYMHKLGKSTEEFKVATITQIMKDDPDCDFILIGDNGERDVDTYSRIRHDPEIGGRIKQVFIHRLYNGGRSLDPMADQLPFLTAADLAAMLYGFNFSLVGGICGWFGRVQRGD
jgi:phosphatidate phosphatase APP1